MKKKLMAIMLAVAMISSCIPVQVFAEGTEAVQSVEGVEVNETTFPDDNFRALIMEWFVWNGTTLEAEDIELITELDVSYQEINDLTGIEYFTRLETLDCYNNNLTSLPALPSGLKSLNCDENKITSITELPETLEEFSANDNNISSLPELPVTLHYLRVSNNKLTSLALNENANYSYIEVMGNYLDGYGAIKGGENIEWDGEGTFFFYPQNVAEENIVVRIDDENAFPDANFRECLSWEAFGDDGIISKSEIANLESLYIDYCGISDLTGLSYFTELKELTCSGNNLTSLPELPEGLTDLDCSDNPLSSLPDLPDTLQSLTCLDCQLTSLPVIPASVKYLNCRWNQLTEICISDNAEFEYINVSDNYLGGFENVIGGENLTWETENQIFWPQNVAEKDIVAYINEDNFPDDGFRSYIEQEFGYDEILSNAEVKSITQIDLSEWGIYDLTGIEYFTSLETLICNNNPLKGYPSLPDGLKVLKMMSCNLSEIEELPSKLEELWVNDNELTSLPALPDTLVKLMCVDNLLTDLPKLPQNLETMNCSYNKLTGLPELPESLIRLICNDNLLTKVELNGNAEYQNIDVSYNSIKSLSDVTGKNNIVWDEMEEDEEYPRYQFLPQNIEVECNHNYGEWIIDVEASCTEAGSKHAECSVCGDVKTEEIESPGHDWDDDYTIDVEASCTEEGSKSIHCANCSETKDVTVINKAEHAYGDWTVDVEASCTEAGSKHAECSVCGDVKTEEIESPGHDWNDDYTIDVEASCTEEGSKSIHCANCSETKEVTVIDKAEHAYGDWIVDVEASCTEAGSKHAECSVCGDVKTEEIESPGHDWDDDYTIDVEASCTEEGSKSIHCANCSETKDVTVINKAEHAYGDWTVDIEASCTEPGSRHAECSVCGEPVTEVIEILGHQWDEEYTIDKATSCTEPGSMSKHCSVCDEIDSTSIQEIAQLDHVNSGKYTVVQMPDCENGAVLKLFCDFCDYEYENSRIETFPLGHKYRNVLTKATTKVNGKIESKCSECGDVEKTTIIYKPSKMTLSTTTYTYTGSVKKPTVKVTDAKGNAISSSNYTVTYASGRKNVGKYAVKVTFKGNYSGTLTQYLTINPKGTSISSLSKASKAFTAKWKKQSTQVTGYQIQYSTSKKFTGAKTVTVSSYKTTSKKITKLSKNKTYYVRVRTYKTVGKTKFYSGWSAAKSVKTK